MRGSGNPTLPTKRPHPKHFIDKIEKKKKTSKLP